MVGEVLVVVDLKKRKKLLKQRGIADCSVKEAMQEASFRKRVMEETYKNKTSEQAQKVAEIMYGDGVLHHFKSYLQRGKNGR